MNTTIFKIKNFLIETLYKIWQNLWLVLVLLLIIDFIISGFLFFRYCFKQEKIETYSPISINQNLVNGFLFEYQNRESFFRKIETKTYLDPFRFKQIKTETRE